MNADISAAMLAEGRLARRAILRQVVVQALAIFIFWAVVNALVRTVIEIRRVGASAPTFAASSV